jgi:acyl-[acyl carrier protein]--UDP-N-acetylglucosamine O-acyltransferase
MMRNLATLFFPAQLQVALHLLAGELHAKGTTVGGAAELGDGLAAMAMTLAAGATGDLVAVSDRLRQFKDIKMARAAEQSFTDRGMVLLDAKTVMSLMELLYEDTDPHCAPFPFHFELGDVSNYHLLHPVGYRVDFHLPWLACKGTDWASAISLAQSALDNHVGLLASIGFQLSLQDGSPAMVQRLSGLITTLSGIQPALQETVKTLSSALNSSGPVNGVESAYARFRTWYQGVVNRVDSSHAYLPPDLAQFRPRAVVAQLPETDDRMLFDLEVEDLPARSKASPRESLFDLEVEDREEHPASRAADAQLQPTPPVISSTASVAADATLENGVTIGDQVMIGTRAHIGVGVRIDANAVIGEFAQIGRGAHIGPGVAVPPSQRVAAQAKITRIDMRKESRLYQSCELHGNLTFLHRAQVHRACVFLGDFELNSNIRVENAVTFTAGAKVNSWSVPSTTENLTAGGSFHVQKSAKVCPGVTVGADVVLEANATLCERVNIGSCVKIASGKSVGAGASIASNLRIIEDIPAGAIVTARKTTLDGREIAHCAVEIAAFTLSKAGNPIPFRASIAPTVLPAPAGNAVLPVLATAKPGRSSPASRAAALAAATRVPSSNAETVTLMLSAARSPARAGLGGPPSVPAPASMTAALAIPVAPSSSAPIYAPEQLPIAALANTKSLASLPLSVPNFSLPAKLGAKFNKLEANGRLVPPASGNTEAQAGKGNKRKRDEYERVQSDSNKRPKPQQPEVQPNPPELMRQARSARNAVRVPATPGTPARALRREQFKPFNAPLSKSGDQRKV